MRVKKYKVTVFKRKVVYVTQFSYTIYIESKSFLIEIETDYHPQKRFTNKFIKKVYSDILSEDGTLYLESGLCCVTSRKRKDIFKYFLLYEYEV